MVRWHHQLTGHEFEQTLGDSESHFVVFNFVTPWNIQSMEFCRPEYQSGQPFPSPGNLPNPGTEPRSSALQVDSLSAEPPGSPVFVRMTIIKRQKKNRTAIVVVTYDHLGFPCGSPGKESTYNAGDLGLIPGLRRYSGEGKGYPLQYSGLENSMGCIVHGVAKTWTC